MPNIENVIKIHEQVVSLSNAPLTIIAGLIWIFITVIFVFYLVKEKNSFSSQGWIFSGVILVVLLSVSGYLSFTIKGYDFSIDKKQWEENYLSPYLKSLPETREYVEDFSQILTTDSNAIKSIYINDKEKPIVVEISTSNKENGTIKKEPVQVLIQKEPINKAYLTYKIIEKNISNEYNTDQYYETILHIPNDYKVIAPTK